MKAPASLSRDNSLPRRKLVYLVTEDWFFAIHFLEVARAARNAGFEVVVVTNVRDHRQAIEAEDIRLVHLTADRRSLSPLALLRLFRQLRRIIAFESPCVIHAVALKSVVLGGLAALLLGKGDPFLGSFTGLGYLWSGDGVVRRGARALVRGLIVWFARDRRTIFSFENEDDRREFSALKNAVVIGGWGVDLDAPPPRPGSRAVTRVVFLGRMLRAKGISDTVEAVRLARAEGAKVELELWGSPDPGNLTSHTVAELEAFSRIDGVRWCGEAQDIAAVWQRADIAILLSEREGMPRSLIEAAASGLPMIATDVPGSRSIVRNGIDGLLVPCQKPDMVARAIVTLAQDADLRAAMGTRARAGFEERFSTATVVPKVLDLYLRLRKMNNLNLSSSAER